MKKSNLTINVADKEFNIVCNIDDKQKLVQASEMVNDKINEIKKHGKTVGFDRVVIMVALNLASDLLIQTEAKDSVVNNSDSTVTDVLAKIENTINEFKNSTQS